MVFDFIWYQENPNLLVQLEELEAYLARTEKLIEVAKKYNKALVPILVNRAIEITAERNEAIARLNQIERDKSSND